MRLLLVALALLTCATACGQDVPTCDTDCTLLGSPEVIAPTGSDYNGFAPRTSACSSTCDSDQVSATANGHAADFQALLTCVGNAGSFSPLCAPLACGLTDAFGTPASCPEGTMIASSSTSSGTGTGTGTSTATFSATGTTVVTVQGSGQDVCLTLKLCCPTIPVSAASERSACFNGYLGNPSEAMCSALLGQLESQGFCGGS